ncbi:16725_t:CDS:2, partial [Racocetra fulgida]
SFTPFQFNAGIQSTQSVESFNGIIKKALNSASTLCDIEKIINKRHEDESQYCKLIDLKDQYMTIGLLHLSSQFFSSVDAILVQFLTPPILSWQRFQISQSFIYEGSLVPYSIEASELETINDYFIEDVLDEPQTTLQSLLNRKCISQRNRYGIAFSTAKTAINVALETIKVAELVRLLKDFIAMNQKKHEGDMDEPKENVNTENYNSKEDQDTEEIILLQEHLIDQITSPNVTKLCDAPHKRRIKAVTELSKGKALNEVTNIVQEADHSETSSRQQH